MLIDGRGIVMDYPCAKFGDFSFSLFGFIVRTVRIIDRITEADDRYTHATTVGVSNSNKLKFQTCTDNRVLSRICSLGEFSAFQVPLLLLLLLTTAYMPHTRTVCLNLNLAEPGKCRLIK